MDNYIPKIQEWEGTEKILQNRELERNEKCAFRKFWNGKGSNFSWEWLSFPGMTRNRNSRSLLHPIAEIRKIVKVKDDSAKYSTKTQVGLLIHDPKRPILSIENIFILNLTLAYYNVCTRVKFNISIPIQFVLIEPCSMFNIYCQSLVRNKIYLWWGFRGVRPMKRRASIRKTEIRAQNM